MNDGLKTLLAFCLATLAAGGTAFSGSTASSGFSEAWNYVSEVDPETSESYSYLYYGVEDVDDARFYAECAVDDIGPFASIELTAPFSNLNDGDSASVNIHSNNGFSYTYDGTITITDWFSGISLGLGFDDQIWTLLQSAPSVEYEIIGHATTSITMQGIEQKLAQFIVDCNASGYMPQADAMPDAGGKGSGGATAATPEMNATCETLNTMQSLDANEAQTVTFVNQSDGYRVVMWIDYDGNYTEYGRLNQGESMTINTFTTHPWMFTDAPGNCLETMILRSGQPIFNITAPNQYFGPE
jgi:hypothetical protein